MKETQKHDAEMEVSSSLSRRKFLNYAGAIAGAGILLAACHKKDDDNATPSNNTSSDTVNLGENDQGLLNYAFLLKQLKAKFYTQALLTPFPGMTAAEVGFFGQMRDHEVAHREFLKNYLGTYAIPMLETDFSSIDFSLKNSVYAKAKLFEEVSTAGLAGICKLMVFADNLLYADKMMSVDARHSATVNNFIYFGSFADKTDENGMERALDPHSSLDITKQFFKRTINGDGLPKY